jgi:hypothetical protein
MVNKQLNTNNTKKLYTAIILHSFPLITATSHCPHLYSNINKKPSTTFVELLALITVIQQQASKPPWITAIQFLGLQQYLHTCTNTQEAAENQGRNAACCCGSP